jgi:hypothetical protein
VCGVDLFECFFGFIFDALFEAAIYRMSQWLFLRFAGGSHKSESKGSI